MNDAPEWLAGAWYLVWMAALPALLLVENAAPRQRSHPRPWRRWSGNLALAVGFWWLGRETLLLGAAASAFWLGAEPPGLLTWMPLPAFIALPIALLLMDWVEYAIHWAYHHNPLLWRLHRLHHSDPHVDLTTTLRQHPLVVFVDVPARPLIWTALGIPPLAVLIYQSVSLAVHLFSHVNWQLPAAVEKRLRRILVTPDFHVVHHSPERIETDSNYGSVLPWWDYLFGTAQLRDAAHCRALAPGLEEFRDEGDLWLHRLLLQPWSSGRTPTG
jgi:sterol desaturase/sphingolipid hydroxylase (fatty acid hydroxylase superfamily)